MSAGKSETDPQTRRQPFSKGEPNFVLFVDYWPGIGSIPAMADYEALSILLASLVKKENLAKFNCSGDIKGRINIHIQLIGSHESITDLPNMSIWRKSDKQLRRNHQRANSWRDSISTKNCLLLHDSLEVDSDKICDKESPSNVHNSEQGPTV